jgi:hypothetical protein
MSVTLPERVSGSTIHVPDWVPEGARDYLAHVAAGQSLRAIAKANGTAPSTICRRVRRIEALRDDPLIDEALDALAALAATGGGREETLQELTHMTAPFRSPIASDESMIAREARRILRRLCETDAVLAVAQDMDKAVVLRAAPGGAQVRTAVVDREVAQAFAVKDWIACTRPGRIARYAITNVGRTALKRLIEEDRRRRQAPGLAEAPAAFRAQHADWGEVEATDDEGRRGPLRVNLAECPLLGLARRRGPDGQPFLGADLVQAGERLREDF